MQAEVGQDAETGESVCVADLVACDAEDPAQAAARNLDWGDFLSGLDGFSRRMLLALARGDSMRSLKAGAGVSDSAMSGRKRKLAEAVLEHFGADCLADAGCAPEWLADVAAHREREACRREVAAA